MEKNCETSMQLVQMKLVSDPHHNCTSEIHRLEANLREAQGHYSTLRTQFQQLRDEFRFNLDVLAERDHELHRYERLTCGDGSRKRFQEQKGPQAQHTESDSFEEIHRKILTQPGVQEGRSLSHEDDQRAHCVNHEEQLKRVDKAVSELQTEMDSLSAQTKSMKIQHQQQLQEREEITDRYKKQLAASLEREKNLEQQLVQMELEWQRNCEDLRGKLYLEHEQLIQELTSAREKVNADLVETKAQLQELTVLLQCVTKERDQALQGRIPTTGTLVSEEVAALQRQNSSLQAVVSEMRKQMEALCSTPPPSRDLENGDLNVSKKEDLHHLEVSIPNVTAKPQKTSRVCSCGNGRHAQMRSRLKQAASCISHLNRDRQQLIELCNGLRAQVCAAQTQSNAINHRVHRCKKSLTSDDLGREGQRGSADPERLSHLSSVRSLSPQLQAHRRSEDSLPSLSALWALLDQGSLTGGQTADLSEDPTDSPPEVPPLGLGADQTQMEVCGVIAPVHTKPTARPLQRKGQVRNTRPRPVRVRNYNIKD